MRLTQSCHAPFRSYLSVSVHNATDSPDPSLGVSLDVFGSASRGPIRVWLHRYPVRYAVVASLGVWRSLVACFVRDEEVVGSNPATPTEKKPWRDLTRGSFQGFSSLTGQSGPACGVRLAFRAHRRDLLAYGTRSVEYVSKRAEVRVEMPPSAAVKTGSSGDSPAIGSQGASSNPAELPSEAGVCADLLVSKEPT